MFDDNAAGGTTPDTFSNVAITTDIPCADPSGITGSNSVLDFLYPLHDGHDGAMPFMLGDMTILASDPDFILANRDNFRALPADGEQVIFLFAFAEGTARDYWDECRAKPTAVLWRDGVTLLCWALEKPLPLDTAKLSDLMTVFGMESLDAGIPLPGQDGWELIHADKNIFSTVEQLAEFYLEETPEEAAEPGLPAHVKFLTPYNAAQYDGCNVWIAIGTHKNAKLWHPHQLPVNRLIQKLCEHEDGKKDGVAVVYGRMDKGQRKKEAIKECTEIGLDYDTGVTTEQVEAEQIKLKYLSVRYTTHSHLGTSTDIGKDDVLKFGGPDSEISPELIRRYITEKKRWEPEVIATAHYVGEFHTDKIVCRISHAPMQKHRLVVFLREPFVIMKEGRSQKEAMAKWSKVVEALGNRIGLPYDRACLDPSRLFYLPHHAKGRDFETSLYSGEMFDWRSLDVDGSGGADGDPYAKSKSKSATPEGRALGLWWVHFGHRFQVMDAFEHHAPERKRDGRNIECGFDSDHGTAGDSSDQACFAVNAEGGEEICTVHCMHNGCADKTALDHIAKLVKDGIIPASVLTDPEFNPAFEERDDNIDAKTLVEIRRRIDGIGGEADQPSDYESLLAGLKESKDQHGDTIKIVDGGISAGLDSIQIGDLKTKIREALRTKDKQPLNDIFKARKSESKKRKATSTKGPEAKFWFYDESKIAKAMDETKLAVVKLGAQRRFVCHDHNDIPQFLLKSDAEIEFAQYRYFREPGGTSTDGFKVWLQSPYRFPGFDEVVFQPGDKPVAENVLNLWRGWGVEPKKGDWPKFKDHIKTIVCGGDENNFKFYMAWWAQMIQDPTTKPGVAPVAKGKKGSGKSIVPYYVRKIIPKNSKVIDKPKSWLGQFNAGLAHCLLLCVEEALFAGNHEHDSAMKNLITSDTLEYEAKFENALQGPNYTRVHITSNEKWVVPATPGERRYFVMNVSPARIGDLAYFKAIADEMENGGCEAFLYDMLRLDYSDVNLRAAPETEGLREQILTGLDPKLLWLGSVLERGVFPFKNSRGPDVTDWLVDRPENGGRRYAADTDEYEIGKNGGCIPKMIVFNSYRDFCPGYKGPDTDQAIGVFLASLGLDLEDSRPTMANKDRPWAFVFPSLDEMRKAFLELVPTYRFTDDETKT